MTALPGLTVRPRFAATRCAVCHDDLLAPGTTCPRCGTVAHLECRTEMARCPTLACSLPSWRVPPRVARTRSRLDWEGALQAFAATLLLGLALVAGLGLILQVGSAFGGSRLDASFHRAGRPEGME